MKKKILLVAEAVTLAHVCRILAVGKMLEDDFDLFIAFDEKYRHLLPKSLEAKFFHLKCIDGRKFMERVNNFEFAYAADEIDLYVKDDLNLLSKVEPFCVIADFRISMAISARIKSIRYLSLTNGYWLDGYLGVAQLPLTKGILFLPEFLRRPVYSLVGPIILRALASPFNQIAKKNGVSKAIGNLRYVFTDSDHILLAEPENWLRVAENTTPITYIGPLSWPLSLPDPEWWDDVDWNQKTLYVSVGSSGSLELIQLVLDATQDMKLQIVISGVSSVEEKNHLGRIFCANFIENAKALKHASVFISNGGSLSMVDALRYGKPTIGIASNFDQWQNIGTLNEHGVGTGFYIKTLNVTELKNAIEYFLDPEHSVKSSLEIAKTMFGSAPRKNALINAIKDTLR